MQLVHRLACLATVMAYLLIALGGSVLATGSGLSCPDWPLCFGQAYTSGTYHLLLEQFHRFTAATVSILVVLLVIAILTRVRHDRVLVTLALAAPILLAIQIVLGGLTVLWRLPPQIITAHLGTALILLGLVISVAVLSATPKPLKPAPESAAPVSAQAFAYLAIANALLVYLLMLLGSYVTGSAAALACTGWPLCTPALWAGSHHLAAINVLHRVVATSVGLVTLWTIVWAWRRRCAAAAQAIVALVAGVLFGCQAIVGGVIVLNDEPAFAVGLHLALGTAVWGTLVLLGALAYLPLRTTTQQARPPGARPAPA
jgi:heme A synthase